MNGTPVTLVGNVVADLRPRRTGEGHRVVSFRMASSDRRFDKATGEWVDGDRLFVDVVCWRNLANGVVMSLAKGDPVVVTGRLRSREFEAEGVKKSVIEVIATAVGPDLSRCFVELRRLRRSPGEGTVPAVPGSEDAAPGGQANSERPAEGEPVGELDAVGIPGLGPAPVDEPEHDPLTGLPTDEIGRSDSDPLVPAQREADSEQVTGASA